MASEHQELEVKFYLASLENLEGRLRASGARLEQPRIHEINLRFDTPDRLLSASHQVLRLRQDSAARVTYKGPGTERGGARLRQELEFTASDFSAARAVFEALGYEVYVMYEKYRAVYALDDVLVTLDEMPYGNFAEIEGPDGGAIQAAAARLGLEWERRILDSYLALFERVKARHDLPFRDLSFENFTNHPVDASTLGVHPADR